MYLLGDSHRLEEVRQGGARHPVAWAAVGPVNCRPVVVVSFLPRPWGGAPQRRLQAGPGGLPSRRCASLAGVLDIRHSSSSGRAWGTPHAHAAEDAAQVVDLVDASRSLRSPWSHCSSGRVRGDLGEDRVSGAPRRTSADALFEAVVVADQAGDDRGSGGMTRGFARYCSVTGGRKEGKPW